MISRKFISLAAIVSLYSCTNAVAPSSYQTVACKSDNDCKGDRICNRGVCEDKVLDAIVSRGVYDTGGEYTPQNESYTAPLTDISQSVPDNSQPKEVYVSSCSPHASKVCYNDDVYWKDSCDKIEDLFENCTTNQYCANATCVTKEPSCTPHAVKVCYSGDVYWKDSCGKLEDKIQTCTSLEKCENASCKLKCTPHASKVCWQGSGNEKTSVYWKNSCDIFEEKAENCIGDCKDGKCMPCEPWFKYCDNLAGGNSEKLYQKDTCDKITLVKDCAAEGKVCNSKCIDSKDGETVGGCWSEGDDATCVKNYGGSYSCTVFCGK